MFVEWNIYFVQNRFHRIQWIVTKSFKSTNTFVVQAMSCKSKMSTIKKVNSAIFYIHTTCLDVFYKNALCEFKFKFSLYCYIRNFQLNTHRHNLYRLYNFLRDSVLIVQFIWYLIIIFLTSLIYSGGFFSVITNYSIYILEDSTVHNTK